MPRERRFSGFPWRAVVTALWMLVTLVGVALLCCAVAEVGPSWVSAVGSVTVATSYSAALALRTGGRPVIYGLLALAIGIAAVGSDTDVLRNGAAVLTAVVSAVFAVAATVPAVRFVTAVREVLVAGFIAAGGALAVVGLEPQVALERFEYTSLAGALLLALLLVYRLGAGLHGLGRRGLLIVAVGGLVLASTLAYAEALRRYGSPDLVATLDDAVAWTRTNLGAVPRPLQVLLGTPALLWGCHMRARRRQGWWVCAFGVAGTVSIAAGLMHPRLGLVESALTVAYGVGLGLVLGYLVIRVDLALTGPRGAPGRRAEEASALRPEPRRTAPLL
ncbi:conserved membrane hypothetical protein [metagenome]|uniref:Uncharacterized protein n=1 Tax=metagenome TaxID=256318 RepID=A0A2P2C0U3_9ZZZZ